MSNARKRVQTKNSRLALSPPKFQATPTLSHKFRFQATAAVTNVTISTADLMSILLVATSTTTTTSLISAFRVKKVSIWGPPAQNLDPVTVSIEYANVLANSGFGQKRHLHSDTSVGATRPAYVGAVPPPGTPAGSWQNVTAAAQTTNGADFILNGPDNMIVDVDLDLSLQNGEAPFTGPVGVGLTLGVIYGNSLDGGAAGLLQSIGLVPIL